MSIPEATGAALPPPVGVQPPPPPLTCSGFYYTVRAGDSLFLIGRRYGCSVSQMMAANPQIHDPNVIYVGQVICVPRCVALPPAEPAPQPGMVEIIIRVPCPCMPQRDTT
ncbi:MAG: LysM domain-containing protein [Bacillota bacterium]